MAAARLGPAVGGSDGEPPSRRGLARPQLETSPPSDGLLGKSTASGVGSDENSRIGREIFIRKLKQETSLGKTKSVKRDIGNGTIRSETLQ